MPKTITTRVICDACGTEHNHSNVHAHEDRTAEHGMKHGSCQHCGAVGKLRYAETPASAMIGGGEMANWRKS